MLHKRKLGQGGLDITTVGFGSWAVGGGGWSFGWGPQDDADSIRAIVHAVEGGVNWIDTAAVYGLGHSEEIVGRALAMLPAAERPLVFTKGGLEWDPDRPMVPARRVSEPASLAAAARPRCVAWPWRGSTCTSFTGPTSPESPWKTPGERWPGSSRRARYGPSASATRGSIFWTVASAFATSTRCSRRSR